MHAARPLTDPGADPQRFEFRPLNDEQGRLLFEGTEVGTLAGVELVAHFAVEGVGWLVVTDCDCPYEELVFLHLLGPGLGLPGLRFIETARLGGAYTPGIVEGMERLGPARFRILFPSRQHRQLISVERREHGLFRKSASWLHVTSDD